MAAISLWTSQILPPIAIAVQMEFVETAEVALVSVYLFLLGVVTARVILVQLVE